MVICEKLHATLSEPTCAQRHLSGRFLACADCAIGAAHAGKPLPNKYDDLCQRCQATGVKIVGKRLCISCYNREREFLKGRNRNGNKPGLRLEYITVLVNGEPLTDLATGFPEMLTKAAKICKPGDVIEPVHQLPYSLAELNTELNAEMSASYP